MIIHSRTTVALTVLFCLASAALPLSADCPSGPVVQPDTFETIGLEPILLDPTANDSHPCGIPLTVTSVTSADCDGVLFPTGYYNNQVFFDPDSYGTCTIDYTVEDQEQASASSTLTLHVLTSDPLATTDPADAQAFVGDSVDFAVTASGGTGSYTFVWQSSETQAGAYSPVSGPEFTVNNVGGQSTLTIDPVALEHQGWYRAVVNDGLDSVTSAAAQLTVMEPCVPPAAPTRELETEQNVSLLINVVTDVVNDPDLEFVGFVSPNPMYGDLEPDDAYPWLWHYHPDLDVVDVTDVFGYQVARADDPSCTADGLVRVSIVPPPCVPPAAPVVQLETPQDTTRTIHVITEILGSDPDLEFVDFVAPVPVRGDLEPDNTYPWLWHYHPDPGVAGVTDVFGYQIALADDPSCTADGLVEMEIQAPVLQVAMPSPAEAVGSPSSATRFQASASGGVAPYQYRWQYKPFSGTQQYQNLVNDANHSGVYSETLTIHSVGVADAGWYRLRVTDSASPATKKFSAPAALYHGGGFLPPIGEVGQVAVGDAAVVVELGRPFAQPVVFAQPPSRAGGDAAVVRLSDVQSDRFTLRIEEAPNHDGIHPQEQVSYLVLEAGTWLLPDGRRLDVGLLSTSATVGVDGASWAAIGFPSPHPSTPAVITQVQTTDDPAWVKTRQQNSTATGFEVALEREDSASKPHGAETVGWLAMETGSGSWTEHPFVAADTPRAVRHVWYSIDFGLDLGASPHFLAAITTYYGSDGSALRRQNLGSTSVEVLVEEDTSADSEVGHTTEVVSYIALGRSGVLSGLDSSQGEKSP